MLPDGRYTLERDGVRYGPYTWAQLRDYYSQGNVVSTDLVWTDGLSDWQQVSGVLANPPIARTPPRPVAPPLSVPRQPASPAGAITQPRGFFRALFSMEGRVNRKRYFWTQMAIAGMVFVTVFVISFAIGVLVAGTGGDADAAGNVAGAVALLISLGFQVPSAFMVVKRLHDIDRPGTHYWLLFVPFYNIYLAILVLFKEGTPGPNRFGPDPLAHY